MDNVKEMETPENRTARLSEFLKTIETNEDLSYLQNLQEDEIASILESVSNELRKKVIAHIPVEKYWGTLHLVQYETAKHIHHTLSSEQRQSCLTLAKEADVLMFDDLLPREFVDDFLLDQSEETASYLQQALSFSDHLVGRYTTPQFLVANAKNSVKALREEIVKKFETPVRLIIVRDSKGIQGAVSPDSLLVQEGHVLLGSLASPTPILDSHQDINEVSQQLAIDGTLQWFPVLTDGKVTGVLSMYSLVSALRELNLKAVVADSVKSEEDLFTPLKVAARLRALWLVINLLTAFLASAIIGLFDTVIEQVVALAILMPVVASMGGIAGSQTLAVALRGIALNHLHQSNLKLLLSKECRIAAFNGVALGLLIAIVVYFVFSSIALSFIIFCAIVVNSLAAAGSATLIPFLLKKLNIDPAVAGSVILTTVTDVVGFLVFLGLGALLLI
ncbi:magnesium transporter [Vibrio coralliilyticus]|uniref:Magnesium transporter n=1 Tax=Vibrio coralliilyticus TaxID=190893 RepID=A0AAP6ZQ77_9VIBR|nr:magnesium transporter [Vibrio coralliilyticus]NOJ26180.1 magnesium transporter [Vibrio coralliilyticus]WFB51132.1 magnesium transporter [Vibrio coralliilyticus]